MKIMIWGAGSNGKVLSKYIEKFTNDEFIGFVDNKPKKNVLSPVELDKVYFDKLIVSNQYTKDREEIKKQCMSLSVDMRKVTFLVEDNQLMTKVFSAINRYDEDKDRRVIWLSAFAHYVKLINMNGNVAEVGVNRGEFAYYINKYFFDRKLYLFDTFEGFPNKDLELECSVSGEEFENSVYNKKDCFLATNVDIVKNRMENTEKVEFYIGYFPESAKDVLDEFCFVSLDTDLYISILSGLEFFYPKMIPGGVILVHDFFNPELPGVEKAINDFEDKYAITLHKFPIADYWSIAIVK